VATYEDLHAGATVLGHDQNIWGVAEIDHEPTLRVVLVKDEGRTRVVGYPPAGTPVTILSQPEVHAEAAAWQTLSAAGFGPVVVRETLN
jgi:hypothetical protein